MSLRCKVSLFTAALTVLFAILTWVVLQFVIVPGLDQEASRFALGAVLSIGAVMSAAMILMLDWLVLRPVGRVAGHTAAIGRTDDLAVRMEGRCSGELGTLQTEFNRMLDRLAANQEQRTLAEDQLRRTEEKCRRIFEDSVLGIFQSTPDGRLLGANNALAAVFGYDSAEELMASVTDIGRQLYTDPARRIEFLRHIESDQAATTFEARMRHRDGSIRWIAQRGRVIHDANGRILFYEGTLEDITQRKSAEEELRKLSCAVDQSPASIVITDTDGRIQYVNRRFTEISGYTAQEAQGRKPSILKSGVVPPDVYADLWETITGGRVWHGELQNRKKNGELYWEYASISPILNEQGVITHFLAVKEDVTARKQADETLRQTVDQLERFNKLTIGREKRIIELKTMVNELLRRLGEPPRYKAVLDSREQEEPVVTDGINA